MRVTTPLRELLGLKHTRIVAFSFTETQLVVAVKPAPHAQVVFDRFHVQRLDYKQ